MGEKDVREQMQWVIDGQGRALLKILDVTKDQHVREIAKKALQRFPEFPPERKKGG